MMRVKLDGNELRLRKLTDDEYYEANAIATQIKSKGLTYCPTCKAKFNDEEETLPTVYKYRGDLHTCDCQAQIALFARYLLAGIPEEYMRLDWQDYDGSPEAREFVDNYLAKWSNYRDHGFGAEFGGPNMGIGKTFAATHIGKEMVKRRQKVYFIPFVEMVAAFERDNANEIEDKIRMTPYVILDDIMPPVSERQKNFYHTRFEAIIRHRTNYNLPTIITTNLTSEQLISYYPRTYSLLAAKQKRIDMDGEDFRGHIGLENMELAENGEVRPIT